MNWKSIADKIKRAAKGIPKTKTNEVINKELDDLLNSTNEKIINKTKDIIENQIPKVMGTDNIKNTVNKTNKAVNNSIQQEQQLLLEAPKKKGPRKPRREYKSNLGTNTEPIQLSGPTKNRRRGNRTVKETIDNSAQQSQQLLLEAPKQKSPRRKYRSDLGTNTKPIPLSGPVREEKRTLNFKKGEGTYTNSSKKRISESAEYNTKLIKKRDTFD